jgi:hypothetical protein
MVAGATHAWPEFEVPVATRFEQDCRACSRNVGPFWKPEASGKPCGVYRDRSGPRAGFADDFVERVPVEDLQVQL